jgi:hypothetical protein
MRSLRKNRSNFNTATYTQHGDDALIRSRRLPKTRSNPSDVSLNPSDVSLGSRGEPVPAARPESAAGSHQ